MRVALEKGLWMETGLGLNFGSIVSYVSLFDLRFFNCKVDTKKWNYRVAVRIRNKECES